MEPAVAVCPHTGDPITAVQYDAYGPTGVIAGRVRDAAVAGLLGITVLGDAPIYRYLRHEGASWIRGHHAPDSKEAQALLAAALLTWAA